MLAGKSDFAVIEAESLTIEMEKDFWDVRQFQHMCPLSTCLAVLGFVLPVRDVPKASHFVH